MDIETTFRECAALLDGHFILSSGLHSNRYLQAARVLQYPRRAEEAGRELAALIDQEVDVVIGPALGGVVIAHDVGRALGVRTMFTERVDGCMELRRGFELEPGERVVIVEDVVTTGGSIREVAEGVRARGATLVCFAALIGRRGGGAQLPAPLRALGNIDVATYDPADCPLCREGIPAVKPGSRSLTAGGGGA